MFNFHDVSNPREKSIETAVKPWREQQELLSLLKQESNI